MQRRRMAGAVLVVVSLGLLTASARTAMAQGVLGPAGGVMALKSGPTLVVGAKATSLKPETRVLATRPVPFRRLPLTVATEVATVVGTFQGQPVTGTVPTPPFTLSAADPYAAGRGFLFAMNVDMNGASGELYLRADGAYVQVWTVGSPTARQYTVHFQVQDHQNSTIGYTVTLPDGSTYNVPGKALQVQDIIVLVPLPNDQPVTGALALATIRRAGPATASVLGVEVTPK